MAQLEIDDGKGTMKGMGWVRRLVRRRWLRRGLLSALALGIVLAAHHRHVLASYLRGEVDLDGRSRFGAYHASSTAGIRWGEVHRHLWPQWLRSLRARPQRHELEMARPLRREERQALWIEQRAFLQLRFALGADRNLVELLDELADHLRNRPRAEARRIDYLLWAYNDYLTAHRVPYRLEASMRIGRDGHITPRTRSYQVMEKLVAEGAPLQLVRRVDGSGVVTGSLGHTGHRGEGATVLLTPTLQFAVQHVWTMLSAGLDDRQPANLRGLAPFVRREAEGIFRPGIALILEETAVDEMALIEVASAIHARQDCGNSFRVYGLPWDGLNLRDRRALVQALQGADEECPPVTLTEAARMIGASERLGSTKDLRVSVEHLTLWVARAVAIHELRHARDHGSTGREHASCTTCPPMSERAQDELSAYVASFATPGLGYLALAQACSMAPRLPPESPHGAALATLLPNLLPEGCGGPIPEDLYARAATLEQRFFGARTHPTLPDDFPTHLRLLERHP